MAAPKRKPKKLKRKPKPKKVMGRPTVYDEVKKRSAAKLSELGATNDEIAVTLGVDVSTIYRWLNQHKDFYEAIKSSKEVADKAVEATLYRSAMGYTHTEEKIMVVKGKVTRVPVVKHYAPNSTSLIFWLKNRRPDLWRDVNKLQLDGPLTVAPASSKLKDFKTFCVDAGYPEPFAKQYEMRAFGIDEVGPRIILGARGYGKTDYVTMLGVAYDLYLDFFKAKEEGKKPTSTNLLVTKSKDRNAAILDEISKACVANGVSFEKENGTCLRVTGLHGKDHSVAAITIGAKSVRGRHPKRTIMDDPVTEDDDSEATRKRVQKLYNELMKLTDNVLIIGQPVHKFDLYETLRPLIKKMEVPYGSIPELDHDLDAQRIAGVSEESIQASYFLKVMSETGMPLEKVKVDLDTFGPGPAVAFIDPSFEGGDYTALTIIRAHFQGVAVKGKCYKRAWYDCLDEMAAEMVACGVQKVCFETNSLGDNPVVMMREVAPEGMGVVGKKSTGHKHSRILMAGAFAKNIHITKDSDRIYIDQVRKYEYKAKNDDAPDSLASAMEWIGLIRGKQSHQ